MRHERATYFTWAADILTVVGHITQHPSIYIRPLLCTSGSQFSMVVFSLLHINGIRYKSQRRCQSIPSLKTCWKRRKVIPKASKVAKGFKVSRFQEVSRFQGCKRFQGFKVSRFKRFQASKVPKATKVSRFQGFKFAKGFKVSRFKRFQGGQGCKILEAFGITFLLFQHVLRLRMLWQRLWLL